MKTRSRRNPFQRHLQQAGDVHSFPTMWRRGSGVFAISHACCRRRRIALSRRTPLAASTSTRVEVEALMRIGRIIMGVLYMAAGTMHFIATAKYEQSMPAYLPVH